MVEEISSKITEYIRKRIEMTEERAEAINFGLIVIIGEGPKLIILLVLAWYFKILELTLTTFIALGIYRSQAGGFHIESHIGCLIFSLTVFCGTSFVAKWIESSNMGLIYSLYTLIFILNMVVISKYAPADTEQIPVINMKKRRTRKIKSYIAVIGIYIYAIFIAREQIVSNICVLTTLIQSVGMLPIAYKIARCEYGEVSKIEYGIN